MLYQERAAPPPGASPDEFVMSDASVDRMGDVIEQNGWELEQLYANIRLRCSITTATKSSAVGATWRCAAAS